jgi:hypothetical protein
MNSDDTLTEKVLEYSDTIRRTVPTVRTPDDWAPVAALVAVEDFERVGTFLEVQDWNAYTEMLTAWANGIERFETVVRRISQIDNLVYYEIEERHVVGQRTTVLNSLTVFEFDDAGKVRHLDVFAQQAPRAERA